MPICRLKRRELTLAKHFRSVPYGERSFSNPQGILTSTARIGYKCVKTFPTAFFQYRPLKEYAIGTIETTFDLSKDLTIITAVGKMEADDFRRWTTDYYDGTVTRLHLWDISRADLSEITVENIEENIIITKNVSNLRRGGKTAFVTPKDLEFGIGRMGEMRYEIAIDTIEYQTFRTFDKAKAWLGV